MSGNTAELESLLFGPYLWSTTLYCEFFHDVSNLANKGNKQLHDLLDDGSKQVFGTSDFVEMMGVEYWDILKLDEHGKDRYKLDKITSENVNEKKRSPVLLLKLIRDKYEHIDEYKDTVKEQLNALTVNGRQFQFFKKDLNGKYHLTKHQFIAFWNSKFPKLVPYLWLELYKVKTELPKYYPVDKINIGHFQNTQLDLTGYLDGLSNALTCDMENGNVFRRFKGLGQCSLEFRAFLRLDKVRDKNKVVTMAVNPKGSVLMSVSHSSSPNEVMKYIGNAPGTEKMIMIFAANLTDDEVWKNCRSFDCRIVIFCDPESLTTEKIEKAVAKFKTKNSLIFELTDSPIKGYELSIDKQISVFKRGQVFVQVREMNIKDIFWNMSTMSWNLSGNLLNKLLKSEKPTLFGNYMYPDHTGVYRKRKLYLNQNEMDLELEHNYVAVNDGSLFELSDYEVFNNFQHLEDEIDSVRSDCECILFKEHKEISEELIENCDNALCCRVESFPDLSCYCLDELNSSIFERPGDDKEYTIQLSETEFLKIIRRKNTKTVFFRAESGMGKSKLLISLGTQLRKEYSFPIFCTFRNFVDILQNNVTTSECTITNVKCVILEILGCKDECERKVIGSWLDRKDGSGTKIELQLDALDEVPSKHLKLALKALKIIENDFDSVRLWITSSRPFPSEMKGIKFVQWNISPFTFNDKYAYFLESWTAKGTNEHWNKDTVKKACSYLSSIDLTDYPLFCGMIAELYADNLIDYCELKKPLFQHFLYESLSKKKFALMIKKKKGMELDNNDKVLEDIYMQVHKYFALLHLFPEASDQFFKPSAMKHLTEENICKMRIITSIERPAVVHLSYSHFFVARFVIDGIRTGELDNLCSEETFHNFLLSALSDKSNLCITLPVWKFVDSYLSEILDWNGLKWLEIHNKEQQCNVQHSSTFVTYPIENHFWHLATLLINAQKSKIDLVECHEILKLAISEKAPLTWVIEMCENLDFGYPNEVVICSVRNGQYEIAKYLINSWCGNNVFDEIAEMREGDGGIFHCIAELINEQNIEVGPRFVEETKQFIMFVHEKNPNEIKRRNNLGQTLLLALPLLPIKSFLTTVLWFESEELLLLKKFLVEDLNADVNATSFDGESILSFRRDLKKASYLFERTRACKYVALYHETLAFVASNNFAHINSKSNSGLTPLEEAVEYFGRCLRKDTLQLFRDLGANFNELDEDGVDSILHYS